VADGPVREHDVAPAVEYDCRVGLVAGEQPLDRLAGLPALGAVQIGFGVRRRVAGRQHQRIAFAQWHIQLLGQGKQQPAAGTGPPGLDEAEVAGGDSGIQREVELAAPPALAPLPK
jgi:hypothetical protein